MKPSFVFLAAIVLAGCATPVADRITEFCAKNGYQPGTAAFLDCFDTVAKANAAHGAVGAVNARTLSDTGVRLMELGQPRVLSAPTRPVTCVQQGVFTTCH